ncbi:mediator of RNA polymerase II transcription subunit 10 [Patellaria atrata CBS 101060]|uniref:Mediator of RNA polymerase II transcription subunit 10 n=1 Tax=Patellaria atrata CBS 101060 TaxID=1346257 RepID=A0A9P4S3W3_9PEZI|nr:mediator of RNA polymerase II transcription subunit 10 [Patellaria atrata CBS 101060]
MLTVNSDQIKAVIQNLYNLIVQSLEYQGTLTEDAMKREIQNLTRNLANISTTAPSLGIHLTEEVIDYVDEGRNPDIYTREFVEMVQKANQNLKGKSEGFVMMRDVLAERISRAMPELAEDVEGVMKRTGGEGVGKG